MGVAIAKFSHPQLVFLQTKNTLHSLQMQSGTKTIILALEANWPGHFIRIITEEYGRYYSIIAPLAVIAEFRQSNHWRPGSQRHG